MRFRMQKEAVPDGNCRRDWPEPRFAGDQTARATRFLLFSPARYSLSLSSFSFPLLFPPFCLSLSLSLYIYIYVYILFVAWLLIMNRCLDLDRRLAVRAPKLRVSLFDESPPLLLLSRIFKFLDSRGRDRNGSVIQLLIADCWFHAAMDGPRDCILRGSRFLFRNSFER